MLHLVESEKRPIDVETYASAQVVCRMPLPPTQQNVSENIDKLQARALQQYHMGCIVLVEVAPGETVRFRAYALLPSPVPIY